MAISSGNGLEDIFCRIYYSNLTYQGYQLPKVHCNASHDGIVCWPPTEEGTNASLPCPNYNGTTLKAYKLCEVGGQWSHWADYTECLEEYTVPPWPILPAFERALTYIYLVGCSLSLILLSVSLIIFCYFRTLHCTRLTIHKHLVVSFILRYICQLVTLHTLPNADLKETSSANWILDSTPSLCRLLVTLLEYFSMCNIFWMFVEGLYLTSTLSVAVFSRETNFRLYIIVGWVSPIAAVVTWAILMHYSSTANSSCWNDYLKLPYVWVVRAPMIAAIIINTVFLINIVRILVTKLRASNTTEVVKLRKTMKAVVVLFPLLGLTNLIFLWAPTNHGKADEIYQIANAILQSSQGIFVSIIYCFLNAEVRSVILRNFSNTTTNLPPPMTTRRIRSTTQLQPNGSYVIAASSEVVLSLSLRKCKQTMVSPSQVSNGREMELQMEIDNGNFVTDGKCQSQV